MLSGKAEDEKSLEKAARLLDFANQLSSKKEDQPEVPADLKVA
jgi:hypothetical protein